VNAALLPDRAIVVGINWYPRFGDEGNSKNLEGPVYDATEMAKWLREAAGAHVTLITSQGVVTSKGDGEKRWTVQDLRPERGDVEPAFSELIVESLDLQDRNLPSRLGRRLYIYMAGHGFSPEARSLSLITAEAVRDIIVPNIEATAWVDWFANQLHFDEIVLWMDCCATRTFNYPSGKPLLKKTAAREDGRAKVFMGFASSPATETFEAKGPDGQVRGLFTERLLRGLKGHAADEQNNVTTSSLIKYMQNSSAVVGTETASTGEKPLPQTKFYERDEMLLATVLVPSYTLLVPVAAGKKLRVKRDSKEIAAVEVKDGKVVLPLTPGLFTAVAQGFSKSFEIGSGGTDHVDLR